MGDADGAIESVLADLSSYSLEQIRALDGTVLNAALRRVVAEAENPREVVAGFDSILSPPDETPDEPAAG